MVVDFDPAAEGWSQERELDAFSSLVGPLWSRVNAGRKQYGFVSEIKHLNRYGRVHGGMLMWFADKALSMTAWEAFGRPHIATIQLDVHFVSGVEHPAFVEAECQIVRQTRSLAFTTGKVLSGKIVIATATGVWKYR